MSHRILISIAATLVLSSGLQGCTSDSVASDFEVRITEQGTCELAGKSVACSETGSEMLALCPNAKCSVVIRSNASGKAELAVVAFKSLTEARLARVSFESRSTSR